MEGGPTYIVGDRYYQILPGGSRIPRKVVRISDETVSSIQNSQNNIKNEAENEQEPIESPL